MSVQSRREDVVIIGGGVIGICCAHYLARKGRRVVVLEREAVGAGSSHGNAGWIVPSHCVPLAEPGVIAQGLKWLLSRSSPFYIKPRLDLQLMVWMWRFRQFCTEAHVERSTPVIRDLQLESRRLYDELAADDGIDFALQSQGAVYVCRTQDGLRRLRDEAAKVRALGLEATDLDAAQVGDLVGGRVAVEGGVLYPQDAHMDPARFVRALAAQTQSAGVDIRTSTEVLGLETAGDRVAKVVTTGGELTAQEVVLAGGAWSPAIGRTLSLDLPIQAAKGYSVTVDRPESCPSTPLMLVERRVAVTPLAGSLRFAGTLELAGMDLSIDERRVAAILDAVPEYLPDIDPRRLQPQEVWCGARPCTPDGLPLLGRTRRYRNLTVAAGHATIGMSLGPVTGKLVAQVVCGVDPAIDLAALRVERFG